MKNVIHVIAIVVGWIVWRQTGHIFIGAIACALSEAIIWGLLWVINTLFSGQPTSEENNTPLPESSNQMNTVDENTVEMNPLPEKPKNTNVALIHKVGSKYHRIGEEQKIEGNYAEIGRDIKCQVRYDEHFETVSSRHAAIMKDDDHWKLLPLSRTNPTFVNGVMVQKEWYLQQGDEIQCAINGPKLVFASSGGQ